MASFDGHGPALDEENETTLVRKWLQGLQVADSESNDCERPESSFPTDKSPPRTPLQQAQLLDSYDEASPTDSAFSHSSIFDSPQAPLKTAVARRPEYAETEASSVCTANESETQPCIRLNEVLKPNESLYCCSSSSLNSYEPPTDVDITTIDDDEGLDEESATTQHLNTFSGADSLGPSTHRVVFLTNCLQCTLTGLTCTRTPPSCSRCTRHNRSEVCLLQRRRLRTEMIDGQHALNSTPVLLRLRSCNEALHARKVELAEQLLREWSAREERKNWVLPRCDERRAGFVSVPARRMHPGEGNGRLAYAVLSVVEERLGL